MKGRIGFVHRLVLCMSTISRPLVVSPAAFPIGFTVVMIASTARVARTALFGKTFEE